MFRATSRPFSFSLRTGTRLSLSAVVRRSSAPRAAFTRRMMSSESHASHGSSSSDTPWMIGSALVFGPLFLYLVSPSARKTVSHGHNDTDHGHANKLTVTRQDEQEETHVQHVESSHEDVKPMADGEGTEVSAREVKESMEKAFESDSPKDAQGHEEVVAKEETTAVEDSSGSATPPDTESSTEPTPLESESEPAATPSADVVAPTITDEKVQGTTEERSEPVTQSKA